MSRDGRYQHYLDTSYEVWRSGGNSDRLNPDRVYDYYDRGVSPERAASAEMGRWRAQREAQQQHEYEQCDYQAEQEYYEMQDAQHYAAIEREMALDAEYGPITVKTELPF